MTEPTTQETRVESVDPLLVDTMLRICADHCSREALDTAERVGWCEPLWRALTEAQLTRVGIGPAHGGSGGSRAEAAELVRVSGYAAAPIPLAETLFIAGPALVAVGLPLPDGPLAAAPRPGELTAVRRGSRWRVTGTARAVAWARVAGTVVALAGSDEGLVLVAVPATVGTVVAGRNLAGEPRDTVVVAAAEVEGALAGDHGLDGDSWREHGSVARALQIAGALERVLDLTVAHATSRVQFGRPIARFQAVSQLIALLGEEVAQARMAAETAVLGVGSDDAAISKIIAGEAATRGAALAHQVHGAMGMTRECDLQLFTRRLWSWRDEFGGETTWARSLGSVVGRRGAEDLWDLITASHQTGTAETDAARIEEKHAGEEFG
jgi:acyl-CoA dehydrogenase